MNLLKKILPIQIGLAFVLIISACNSGMSPPKLLPGETLLGSTKAAHSLTRTHNRKIIYDPGYNHWYIFWLRDDGNMDFNKNEEGVVYQFSGDGTEWSQPVLVEPFQRGGISAWDVVLAGDRLYLLGLTDYPDVSGDINKYAVRELEIRADGSLVINPPKIVHDNSDGHNTSIHFYGSLLYDSKGFFWIAARVGDSTPGTHADVIRSTKPGSIAAWGANGCIGKLCNNEWINPYAKSGQNLLQGTIANRLLDLGQFGIGLVTFNKNDSDEKNNPHGQIIFVRNPSDEYNGWEAKSIVLTDSANQYRRPNSDTNADKTRLDDRRFSAIVDPLTQIIHVAYVAADTGTPEDGNLRYFTLSPPYRLEDKSIETTIINKEVDGVELSIDTRTNSSILYLFYVANEYPDYQIRMIRKTEKGWSSVSNISSCKGPVRYPQTPESVVKDEMIVGYQYPEKQSEGYIYHICVKKIDLLANPDDVK